jgi:hypothetical protein
MRTFSTVALFARTQRGDPAFALRRMLLLEPLLKLKHVELAAPEFSKRFALTGADHGWLRRMFDHQVIDLIISTYAHQRFQISGGGPWLAFTIPQTRLKPEKWRGFLQDMSRIAIAVFERARADDTAAT